MKVFTTSWGRHVLCMFAAVVLFFNSSSAQQPVPRQWNETMLNCIRKDQPRPTVMARRLYLAAISMYDAWAVYDEQASTVLLGKTVGNFTSTFDGIPAPADVQAAREKCISYAMYRFLKNHFSAVPPANQLTVNGYIENQMTALGYDASITSTNYTDGDPAKLGNYIAAQVQAYALQDGSNQSANYANQYYVPVNGQLQPQLTGNPDMYDPNRWQSLCLSLICEQGTDVPGVPCVPVPCNAPALTPEWGNVVPFSLREDQKVTMNRDGHDYHIFLDPGPPPLLDTTNALGFDESFFKWGFCVNSIWHSFHTLEDDVMIDISPANIGNVDYSQLPTTFEEYKSFYDVFNGGTIDQGYTINPATGLPYEPNFVHRGDYTRVLSEYWADGPTSETPPGHWFTITNHVADHEDFEMRWEGQGELMDPTEWYVKTYLSLGAGVHDAAIACWSAKGYYDYSRPIMSIRYMADHGQCSDPMLPNYHPAGFPLIPGYIEMIEAGDPLEGEDGENIGKVKLYTWKGPEPATGENGVGWKLAQEWWTYQKNTFVTPPFPAYYSGHSTYSRTCAEILTLLTGDEYFPGGMGEFTTNPGGLFADSGPSEPITMQWARYRDAADQCSLSRIYGGLHPPQDDIPGRFVGMVVGPQVYEHAETYFDAGIPRVDAVAFSATMITDAIAGNSLHITIDFNENMNTASSPALQFAGDNAATSLEWTSGTWVDANTYQGTYTIVDANATLNNVKFQITAAQDLDDNSIVPFITEAIAIDTQNPTVNNFSSNTTSISDYSVGTSNVVLTFAFDEMMDVSAEPVINFIGGDLTQTLSYDDANSGWDVDGMTFTATYTILDGNQDIDQVDAQIVSALDLNGNTQVVSDITELLAVDTKNPAASVTAETFMITDANTGSNNYVLTLEFDEDINTTDAPTINFTGSDISSSLILTATSGWTDMDTYTAVYYVNDQNIDVNGIGIQVLGVEDFSGNQMIEFNADDMLDIDTRNPQIVSLNVNETVLADADAGASALNITFTFDEDMDTDTDPAVVFAASADPLASSLTAQGGNWTDATHYVANYTLADAGEEIWDIDVTATGAADASGNAQEVSYSADGVFSIDTKNPTLVLATANTYNITSSFSGANGFTIATLFDEPMNTSTDPVVTFPNENPSAALTSVSSQDWISSTSHSTSYTVANVLTSIPDVDVAISGASDAAGNAATASNQPDFFSVNIIISVNELSPEHQVNIYPNPTQSGNNVYLEWNKVPTGLQVDVFDSNGKLIWSKHAISASEKKIAIETNGLSTGLYFVHINSDEGKAVYNISITK
ncbi:MAG: T9SS type A sorting domain-containing protein [Flavobacteriales bacterium]|nr:T9SS type A sorting domain-containing protein [Flavobacteriales bacterium]